jgi:hypothetical protein
MTNEPTNPAPDSIKREPVVPQREPIMGTGSVPPAREPDQGPERAPQAEEPPRREGVVSDPDMKGLEATPH